MALGQRLDLRQSQSLVMTPQLQQAIKLLQLTNLELADYVSEEIEKNPLLDVGSNSEAPVAGEGPGFEEAFGDNAAQNSAEADTGMVASDKAIESGAEVSGGDSPLDADFDTNVFNNDAPSDMASGSLSYDGGGAIRGSGGVGDDRGLDQTLEEATNLHDFLNQQMSMALFDPTDCLIATHMIDCVDDSGYLTQESIDDIADKLGVEPQDMDRLLEILQGLEPTGVFARNLPECLGLQLKELDRLDPAMQALLDNIHLLAEREMSQLKKLCGVDSEDMTDMVREIRALNPKPGLMYGSQAVEPVVPDVFVRKSAAGTWIVELNTDTLPRVLMNSQYLSELQDVAHGKQAKNFISDCVSQANWLVKALDQRARTILKVSIEIVKQQEQFFEHGVRFMRPLILKDIADEIEMHESTVSRVTNNKFMATSRGMFELKYFFSSSISSAYGGEAHSAESVKYRIKELIDEESPKKILSDDKLVVILEGEGIDIARRTVAKYREALRLGSSVQRRRAKNLPK